MKLKRMKRLPSDALILRIRRLEGLEKDQGRLRRVTGYLRNLIKRRGAETGDTPRNGSPIQ